MSYMHSQYSKNKMVQCQDGTLIRDTEQGIQILYSQRQPQTVGMYVHEMAKLQSQDSIPSYPTIRVPVNMPTSKLDKLIAHYYTMKK